MFATRTPWCSILCNCQNTMWVIPTNGQTRMSLWNTSWMTDWKKGDRCVISREPACTLHERVSDLWYDKHSLQWPDVMTTREDSQNCFGPNTSLPIKASSIPLPVKYLSAHRRSILAKWNISNFGNRSKNVPGSLMTIGMLPTIWYTPSSQTIIIVSWFNCCRDAWNLVPYGQWHILSQEIGWQA